MGNTTTSKSTADDVVMRRLYARGTWKLNSVAHFGGKETGVADMCLLQDADGKPFIPGTSIAGAARSFLAQQRKPWRKYKEGGEGKALKRFFGGHMQQDLTQSKKNKDTMSALIVSDAIYVSEEVNRSIRDGVSIDIKSGTAKTGAKYDVEVLERGTEFELELQCIVRKANDGKKIQQLFLALLYAFQQGDIRLGARTRRGYGRGKVESWEIRDLQMNDPQDVMAWLRDDPWFRPKNDLDKKLKNYLKNYTPPSDQRRYFRIEADFKLRTSLLIRSVSGEPGAPDMAHLQSDGKPVVPGTSFAGVFRHRALLIARTVGFSEEAMEKMFGFVREKKSGDPQQPTSQASRIRIEERLVKRVKPQWQDRVAIDRFTGGSLQSALFNEKPAYPLSLKELKEKGKKTDRPNIRLRLTLEEPEKAEIGLLLLTLRDFWYGHVALGGETSNGRGTLQGIKAKLIYKDNPDPSDLKVWKLARDNDNKRMTIENGDEEFLQCCVAKAQN